MTLLIHQNRKRKAHHHVVKLMGCAFVFSAIHEDPHLAWNAIRRAEQETIRIEKLISSWREDSQTSKINSAAGRSYVRVDEELFKLIERSIKLSKMTKGAFDISGNLARYFWKFDGMKSNRPTEDELTYLKDRMNYFLIQLKEEDKSVFLAKEGMSIGFGAIGKGYAAYRSRVMMEELGIKHGMVNAAGDLYCWGKNVDMDKWKVNISDPDQPESSVLEFFIPHGAVVTSGGYEKFALINGRKFSHIVDPRTGLPVSGLKSVSVICPNPELGDALATAVTVLGEHKGLELINRLEGVECVLINDQNKFIFSRNLKI